MINPVTTYRIQFHKGFNFCAFRGIIPYLQQLGIATIYASPIFKAVPGSVHGYDVVDPNVINPEIGTIEELYDISKELKERGMFWVQDIVPNHMAYHYLNPWLSDVLLNGKKSKYAEYFDINWNRDEKLMAPFLGSSFEDAINNREIQLIVKNEKYYLKYHDSLFPAKADRVDQQTLHRINSDANRLTDVCMQQAYKFCHWKETDSKINYRRFFTINGLISINIQHKNVFDDYHSLTLKLLHEKVFDCLRIDHVDGLFDPTKYLQQLRHATGNDIFIIVEKILERDEKLPENWPIQGSTGYDFLAQVNNLFTNTEHEEVLSNFYQETTHTKPASQQIAEKKGDILLHHMAGDLENLTRLFFDLKLTDEKLPQEEIKETIGSFLIHCPVYRLYGNSFPLRNDESVQVQKIFEEIRKKKSSKAVAALENIFIKYPLTENDRFCKRVAMFYQRCMQFTGPVMAKGVEDTLMYTYNSFIAHNEVGDSPNAFGITRDHFHRLMKMRQRNLPLSINATSTHDTKRGEDVRARLNVLSDVAEEWISIVRQWQHINQDLKNNNFPDANDEYLIYQSLVGSYPLWGGDRKVFLNRFQEYLTKALREAKTHSNWANLNEEYEKAANDFAAALLDENRSFWKSFSSFLNRIADHGIVNSLSQVILKFTCPGVPDIYQGSEDWDFSFVDPDNRRLVDFKSRCEKLNASEQASIFDLWNDWHNGAVKQRLIKTLCELRKQYPELWTEGEYVPLKTSGKFRNNVGAFARIDRGTVFIIALPLHTAELCSDNNILQINWGDTAVKLPPNVDKRLANIFTGTTADYTDRIDVANFFNRFPAIILNGAECRNRGAGILLHVTSLPSPFGIGDIGPTAKKFVNSLHAARQQYWQMLPINPTEEGQAFSPYSATSGMAGYPLLISPDLLVRDGLLSEADLKYLPGTDTADFAAVANLKTELFDVAYNNFSSHPQENFERFCKEENYWLHDFALYTLLKSRFKLPWYEWPDEYKLRKTGVLESLVNDEELKRIKWLQFIFFRQWNDLKTHCNEQKIKLIGDLPFYVSYDSADVWANREIFAVDETGERTGLAGVPPDAFSVDGQLWGMPVYCWSTLKKQNYAWWKRRIRKNLELFDIIRIDHFRAFVEYWEVPPGAQTAKNGRWETGPGEDFFHHIKKDFPALPFIAEDLGDVDDKVFALRDAFGLPGMKVLQFAFGEDLPKSLHIPHHHAFNFVVYTGTHDNNTSRGWFTKDADDGTKKRLQRYLFKDVSEVNIAETMIKTAYSSVASIAIIPMQDILNLDQSARMNTPASVENNWTWRMKQDAFCSQLQTMLKEWTQLFGR